MPHVLIVKTGALGDVVRTSHFAGALRECFGAALRLSWITSESAAPLLARNPHIDDLWTDFESQLIVEGPSPAGRRSKR